MESIRKTRMRKSQPIESPLWRGDVRVASSDDRWSFFGPIETPVYCLLSTVDCLFSVVCCLLYACEQTAPLSFFLYSLHLPVYCQSRKEKNEATQFKTWLSMRTNSFMIVPTSLQLLFWFHFFCYSIGRGSETRHHQRKASCTVGLPLPLVVGSGKIVDPK